MSIAMILSGCGREDSRNEPKPADTVNFPAHKERDSLASETYELVNLSELPMEFEMGFGAVMVTPGNAIGAMTGHARRLTLAGKEIALVSDQELTVGGTNTPFVVTKDYGKVKVAMNSDWSWTFWLTPSQKAEFMKMK